MSYCLNPKCPKPQNPNDAKFCSTCGARLLLGDRYRALQLISRCGVGRTFLAVDEREATKPHCIIKQFSPANQGTNNAEKAAESFRQEAARLQELGQHPQIPQLLAYFEQDDQVGKGIAPAIVQAYIKGQSLAEKLEAEGTFSEAEIRQILNEVLPVLQFVHDKGIIHRDINPDNIIRTSSSNFGADEGERGRGGEGENLTGGLFLPNWSSQNLAINNPKSKIQNPKSKLILVDFTAAKFTTKTALAKTGTVVGSAAYAAQEQLMGKAVPSSDLYSLAVTCIHLLTHVHPFDLFNTFDGVWVWQDYAIAPVSQELSRILNKMLESAVSRRYQAAEEVLKDLNPDSPPVTTSVKSVKSTTHSPPTAPKTLTPTWQCIRTLKGHHSSINALAFSPNGQTLGSGSADRTVKLWNSDGTGGAISLAEHLSLVDAVTFSPDGRILASGSWDHTIKIWNLGAGLKDDPFISLTHDLRDHSGWIMCVAIAPDGCTLISGSADKTIKLWDLETGELRSTLLGHSHAVRCIAISPDGQTLASGSADKTIKLWDLGSGDVQLTLEGHSDAVNSLTFSPSGQILISGSADKTIKIWDLGSGSLLEAIEGHTDAVNSVAINAQGNTLVSGSADNAIKIWHPGSGNLLHVLSGHSASVTCVVISPDSRLIASGSQDKTIKIWQFD